MKRWAQFILIFSVCLLSLAVRLQASEQRVTSEMIKVALPRQGFEVISETRTMLGRVRFVAFNELIWREVVLERWSRKFGPGVKVDRMTKETIRNGKEKDAYA